MFFVKKRIIFWKYIVYPFLDKIKLVCICEMGWIVIMMHKDDDDDDRRFV